MKKPLLIAWFAFCLVAGWAGGYFLAAHFNAERIKREHERADDSHISTRYDARLVPYTDSTGQWRDTLVVVREADRGVIVCMKPVADSTLDPYSAHYVYRVSGGAK